MSVEHSAITCAQQQLVWLTTILVDVFEQVSAQFERERHYTLFAAFPIEHAEEIAQVDVADVQRQRLGDAASCVEQQEHEQMQPALIEASGLVVHEQPDLFRGAAPPTSTT